MACFALAAAGCGVGLEGVASRVGVLAPCRGSFVDADAGIIFAPPVGTTGPEIAEQSDTLRIAVWRSSTLSREPLVAALSYPVAPLSVDVDAVVEAGVQTQRELLTSELEHTILTDDSTVLDGGNEAHVLTGASSDGQVASVIVLVAGTDRFVAVFMVGASGALETMLVSALTVCVD